VIGVGGFLLTGTIAEITGQRVLAGLIGGYTISELTTALSRRYGRPRHPRPED